jgi:hypothetical protein
MIKQLEENLDSSVKKSRGLESQVVCLLAEKEGLEQELAPLQTENQKLTEANTEQQAPITRLQTDNDLKSVSRRRARHWKARGQDIIPHQRTRQSNGGEGPCSVRTD